MHIGKGHRLQVVAHGDPLVELAQFLPTQQAFQFGLPHQDDLDQFGPFRFQVGDQADLLQD